MKWYRSSIIAALLLLPCSVASAAMTDAIDATCRVAAPDGSVGSGCVFEISKGTVFVLTNRHVVGQAASVKCVFWQEGHQSAAIAGQVLVRSDQVDVAILTIPVAAFGGRGPRAIPLVDRGTQLGAGQVVTSVGCAEGRWSTGWKGRVLGYDGAHLCFTPTPADGRSGSALFDAAGEHIVGLIWGRLEQGQGLGYAVPAENLYRAINYRQVAGKWQHSPRPLLNMVDRAQYRPAPEAGACPDCEGGFCERLFPGRFNFNQRPYQRPVPIQPQPRPSPPGGQLSPYPTLPPPTQVVPMEPKKETPALPPLPPAAIGLLEEFEQLKREVQTLRKMVEACAGREGPQGPIGPQGLPGEAGADGTVDVSRIAEQVRRKIQGAIRVEVRPITKPTR